MKKINLEVIKSLNPCQDRLDNYIKHYNKKSFTKQEFMGLKKITIQDKMWVAFRLMPKDNIRLAAADIAETVLSFYEKQYPNDDRPRKAIEAARSGSDAAYAAAAAANAAAANAAAAAANAAYAAYAAAAAANAAAANAAAAAANAAYAAYAAAAYDAAYAAVNKNKQDKLNIKIILKYWK